MAKALVDDLSGAIQGGQADNATLVDGGNPHLFPYKHNEGQFHVLVPAAQRHLCLPAGLARAEESGY
ncbi:DUF3971 domain-containing protein [Shigella flexneri]